MCHIQVLMWLFSGLTLYRDMDGDPFAGFFVSLLRSLFSSLCSVHSSCFTSQGGLCPSARQNYHAPPHAELLECCLQVSDSSPHLPAPLFKGISPVFFIAVQDRTAEGLCFTSSFLRLLLPPQQKVLCCVCSTSMS